MTVVLMIWTANPYYSRVAGVILLASLWLCWLTATEIRTDRDREVLGWVIVGTGVIVAVETLCQVYVGHGLIVRFTGNPAGTIGNTNFLGAYLLFPIFAALGVRYGWAALPVLLWALFLSRARASWLGFGIGFALWLWWRVPRRTFAAVALWAVLGLIVGLTWFPNACNRWAETDTLRYRVKYWQAAVEIWRESPVFGAGLWSYRNQVYEAQARLGQKDPKYWQGYVEPKPRRAHNDYLESLVDGGIVYAVLFWGFIGACMTRAVKLGRHKTGMFCGQVAVLMAALFFFPFRVVDTLVLFFVQMGALCGSQSD